MKGPRELDAEGLDLNEQVLHIDDLVPVIVIMVVIVIIVSIVM